MRILYTLHRVKRFPTCPPLIRGIIVPSMKRGFRGVSGNGNVFILCVFEACLSLRPLRLRAEISFLRVFRALRG